MTRGVVARRIARLLSSLVYREIDVRVDPALTAGGPIIAVSNHFGGLADGVLLVDAMPTMPRIVARDVIWKIPLAGRLMSAVGGIPVHRRADGSKASNDEMFASCYDALRAGDTILIFPEGVTQDVPHIAPVKTGAARIALGARASGVSGIRIVPVGLHYEDKAGFRSRVLVNAGPALDVDAWVGVQGEHPEAVAELTGEITSRLQAVAPDFPDWPTADAYSTAASVPLRDVDDPDLPLRYGDVQLLAARLREADADSAVADLAARYRGALLAGRTSDEAIARGGRRMPGRQAQARWRDVLVSTILLPYALLGLFVALVPWLLVQAVRLVPAAPAVRATITPGLALLVFGLEWIASTWFAFAGVGAVAGLLALLLFPFFVAATAFVAERINLLWRWHATSRRPAGPEYEELAAARSMLAEAVWGRL